MEKWYVLEFVTRIMHTTRKTKSPLFYTSFFAYKFCGNIYNNDFLEEVTFQTNLYNTQHSTTGFKVAVKKRGSSKISYKKVAPVAVSEIRKVFGIILYMGVHKFPNRRLYWGSETNVPFIEDAMSRNRFEEILSILHFSDNEQIPRPECTKL